MLDVIKYETEIENIYTYYEFQGYDGWEEFDNLLLVLTNQIRSVVLEKLDGIYSRHCILEQDGFVFKLMYHEDFGNCLCSQHKKDDTFYDKLEKIAHETAQKLKE